MELRIAQFGSYDYLASTKGYTKLVRSVKSTFKQAVCDRTESEKEQKNQMGPNRDCIRIHIKNTMMKQYIL